MDIFDLQEKSIEDQAMESIVAYRVKVLDDLKSGFETNWNNFWFHQILSAQAQCDYYGNNAYLLFQKSQKVAELIKYLDPEWEAPIPPREYTINDNGSVTIEPEVVEEEVIINPNEI